MDYLIIAPALVAGINSFELLIDAKSKNVYFQLPELLKCFNKFCDGHFIVCCTDNPHTLIVFLHNLHSVISTSAVCHW